MAIAWTVHTTSTGTSASSDSGSLTPKSGSDRGLICIVEFLDGSGGTTISDVKWDTAGANISLTLAVSVDNSDPSSSRTRITAIYYLQGTDPGETSKNWSVTFSEAVSSHHITWISLTGVDQTDFKDAVSSGATGNSVDTEDSITTSDATTAIFVGSLIQGSTSHTPITNTTEEYDGSVGGGPAATTGFVGSRAVSSAGSYTVGSDAASSNYWSCCAMSIKEAAVAAGSLATAPKRSWRGNR